MRRPTGPHPIKDILGQLQPNRKWDEKLKQYALFFEWPKIVGDKIAAHAEPVLWQGSVLKIEVDHPTWMQEIKMMEEEILQKIRKNYPEILISKIRLSLKTAGNSG